MRIITVALAAASLAACVETSPSEVVMPAAPIRSLPPAPPVDATPLPPSDAPAPPPVDPVIFSTAPTSPDPERSGCLITYDDGTQAVQRRTEEGMQQTPADFLDPVLVGSLEPC